MSTRSWRQLSEVLDCGSEKELVLSTGRTSQPEPVESQNALEMREQHLDFFTFNDPVFRTCLDCGLSDPAPQRMPNQWPFAPRPFLFFAGQCLRDGVRMDDRRHRQRGLLKRADNICHAHCRDDPDRWGGLPHCRKYEPLTRSTRP